MYIYVHMPSASGTNEDLAVLETRNPGGGGRGRLPQAAPTHNSAAAPG